MDNFFVRTTDTKTTVAGRHTTKAGATEYDMDEAQANADAKARNAQAEALGVKTRYEAVPAE